MLPGAVAELQHQIAIVERKQAGSSGSTVPRYPLAPDQIAYSHYAQRLRFDDQLRHDPRYAAIGIDDVLVQRLREAIAGRASDQELADLVGVQIERFRRAGNLDAKQGSDEWRVIARVLCQAEYETLARAAERDEGDYTGQLAAPMLRDAQPPENEPEPVILSKLWEKYKNGRIQAGFMKGGGGRQNVVIENLRNYIKHNDASRLTKKDLIDWRDNLMKTKSAKTVSDTYLSTVRTLLKWAVENDLLRENVASTVKQPKPRKQYSRERGFTEPEAVRILNAARSYEPNADKSGYIREKPHLVNAKRWAPILCAFSGARITEITQLRKADVREVKGRWVVRISSDAGTVKAGGYRDVPLHMQIIDEGFIEFVQAAKSGPLFHGGTDPVKYVTKATRISNQIAEWMRKIEICPDGVRPNHGWRHRFKTLAREIGGVSDRVIDATQGHVGRTAGDDYGDVTLKAKADLIDRLPSYPLSS